MLGIKIVIDKLSSLVSGKPEIKFELIPFDYSVDIDDSDEKDVEFTGDVYPSKPDIPSDKTDNIDALEAWRERSNTLISGISIPIGMQYSDASGNLTKRQVEVKKIFKDELRYLSGFCFLRESYRTFREDRIGEIIELETGEVHHDSSTFLDRYGIFNSEKMEELQVILHILIYLARVDRRFIDAEKDVMSKIIAQYCSGEQKDLVESYAFSHKVAKKDYLNEIAKLAYMDLNVVEFLIRKSEELITVDGKITPKEQEFFGILKDTN